MSLFEELKRRKVFRLVAAYLVVAWLLVQVVTAIEDPLRLPEWFDTAVIVLLGLGLPIVVILGWIYDVTPAGVVRDDGEGLPTATAGIDYGKISLVAVLVLSAFLAGTYLVSDSPTAQPPPSRGLQQFGIAARNQFEYPYNETARVAISADGAVLAGIGGIGSSRTLYWRTTSDLEFRSVDSSIGISNPFDLSRDGSSLVYYDDTNQTIYKVSLLDGIPLEIGRPPFGATSISWGDGGMIAMSRADGNGLMTMPDTGGAVEQVSFPQAGEAHKHPAYLPGSDTLVFVIGDTESSFSRSDRLAFLKENGEIVRTDIVGASPIVSSDGYLVFFRHSALWTVQLDLESLEITGEPKPIVTDVYYRFFAHFDISQEGSLFYRRDSARGNFSLVWVDRIGAEEPTRLEGAIYNYPRVSPDGNSVAVTVDSEYGIDLWTYSLGRGTPARWTFDETRPTGLVWSPRGDYLYFESGGNVDMRRVAMAGNGVIETLSESEAHQYPSSISADGSRLFFSESQSGNEAAGRFSVGVLDMSGEFTFSYPILTRFWDSHPSISPDGRWLAFMSNRTGEQQIYVVPYPVEGAGAVQVSTDGGWLAEWNGDGSELYYWADDAIMSVAIDTSKGFSAGDPVPLFNNEPYVFDVIGNYDYDPSREKFLMVKRPPPGSTLEDFVLIQNWTALLAKPTQ